MHSLNKVTKTVLALIVASIFFYSSCKKEESNSTQNATVRVHLTDAPGLYKEVNIDIIRVEIHSDQTGWISIDSANAGIYNLLDFTNGADTLLGDAELPAGSISQMRLILGENNSLLDTNNVRYDLKTPSAQQSGIKFNIHQTIENGITYDVWIDFNADKSVVKRGNGKYNLKPVIRAYTKATSGAIKGIALPDSANSYIFAVQSGDTFSTYADTTGYYLLGGLPANSYDVYFTNSNGYKDSVINSVTVTNGSVTDMDTTTMTR